MMSLLAFWVLMLYHFELKHSAAEAVLNLELDFGLQPPFERTMSWWLARLPSGDFILEGEPDYGWRMSLDDQMLPLGRWQQAWMCTILKFEKIRLPLASRKRTKSGYPIT